MIGRVFNEAMSRTISSEKAFCTSISTKFRNKSSEVTYSDGAETQERSRLDILDHICEARQRRSLVVSASKDCQKFSFNIVTLKRSITIHFLCSWRPLRSAVIRPLESTVWKRDVSN